MATSLDQYPSDEIRRHILAGALEVWNARSLDTGRGRLQPSPLSAHAHRHGEHEPTPPHTTATLPGATAPSPTSACRPIARATPWSCRPRRSPPTAPCASWSWSRWSRMRPSRARSRWPSGRPGAPGRGPEAPRRHQCRALKLDRLFRDAADALGRPRHGTGAGSPCTCATWAVLRRHFEPHGPHDGDDAVGLRRVRAGPDRRADPRALARKKELGFVTGSTPYGWKRRDDWRSLDRKDPERKRLYPHEQEQALISPGTRPMGRRRGQAPGRHEQAQGQGQPARDRRRTRRRAASAPEKQAVAVHPDRTPHWHRNRWRPRHHHP